MRRGQIFAWLFVLSLTVAPASSPGLANDAVAPTTRGADALLFVANAGQFDPAVRFQAHTGGGVVWVTDDAVWISYLEPVPRARTGRPRPEDRRRSVRGVNLKLTFPGLALEGRPVPVDPQRTVFNYFLGDDSSRWRSEVPTYGGVRFAVGSQAAALELREAEGRLALLVAGDSLGMRVEGAAAVRESGDGRLTAETALGDFPLPVALHDGRRMRTRAEGATIAFRSDGSLPASPAEEPSSDLLYGTFLGGGDDEQAFDVDVGSDGSIYAFGQTFSPSFPTTPGAFDRTYDGPGGFGGDAFVSRLDETGSSLVYSTFLGGDDTDYGLSLAVGPDGSAYLGGYTHSTNFPTTPGSFGPDFNGGCCDVFVTRLNPGGSVLLYSTFLGGQSFEAIGGLALGPDGVVHLTGETLSPNFPTTPGAYDRVINRNGQGAYGDAWVTALAADGSALEHSTFLGGVYNDYGLAVAVTTTGQAVVTGETQSRNFPTTKRAFDRSLNGGSSDAFVTKLNPAATKLRFSTYLGGNDREDGSAVTVDETGAAYVVGSTSSPNFPTTPGAYDRTINSFIFSDAFATKLSATGRSLGFSTFLGGEESDFAAALALMPGGTVVLTGTTHSANFPTTPGGFDRTLGGPADAFVTRLDALGSSLQDSTFLGGNATVVDTGVAVAASGPDTVYVAGDTFSDDFPTTPGAYDRSHNGRFDAFVASLNVPSAR
jgi:hypothetical protein